MGFDTKHEVMRRRKRALLLFLPHERRAWEEASRLNVSFATDNLVTPCRATSFKRRAFFTGHHHIAAGSARIRGASPSAATASVGVK